MSTMTEERVTSATGGMKGRKAAELGTLDPLALLMLAEVSGYGAKKYGEAFNFLKGYDWSLSWNAAQRHLLQFWSGEDHDDESGLLHVLHAGWHCLALASFIARDLGTDDRYKQGGSDGALAKLRAILTEEPVFEPNPFYARGDILPCSACASE